MNNQSAQQRDNSQVEQTIIDEEDNLEAEID